MQEPGLSRIENDAHGIESSNEVNRFLHSEVNLLIQHFIVRDQDGQNNNKLFKSKL